MNVGQNREGLGHERERVCPSPKPSPRFRGARESDSARASQLQDSTTGSKFCALGVDLAGQRGFEEGRDDHSDSCKAEKEAGGTHAKPGKNFLAALLVEEAVTRNRRPQPPAHPQAKAGERSTQGQMIHDACTTPADDADENQSDAEQELQDGPWHGQQAQVGQKSENNEGLEHALPYSAGKTSQRICGILPKCRSVVATCKPCCMAEAAIQMSLVGTGVPATRRPCTIAA